MIDAEAQRPDGAEVIAIMTPNDSHFQFSMAALNAGMDVICDKPMTNTLDEALALIQKVQSSGLVYCLTHNYTGYPMVKEARDFVAAGKLGKINKVVVEYPQGYAITGADAGNYALAQPTGVTASITQLTLNLTGVTAASKTYDAQTGATISGGVIAPISGDAVTLDISGRTGVFADKNVGASKSVTVSGYTISGADAGNYSLVQPTGVTADITTLSLAVTGATAASKTYDALLAAAISGGTISVISGDIVSLDISGRSGVFGDKNVGTGKSVTVSGYTISGADAANYSLVQPTGLTADITALSLAVTGATAANKTYDRLLGATISGGVVSVISGDRKSVV